ncbi:MAG: hypothetical protein ACO24B_01470 [Ilumatobacteraceae bacterium]
MTLTSDDYQMFPSNLVLSTVAGSYAFLLANLDTLLSIGLPIAFFVVGKGIDVAVKLYLEKQKKSDV